MSRQRCQSLDRGLRRKQRLNIYGSGGYVPGRSPNRSPPRTRGTPRCVPSTPEIFRYQANVPTYALDEFDHFQYGHHLADISALEAKTPQREQYTVRAPQFEEMSDEFLDEYVEPTFYEPPANASYDELMCILASPTTQPQEHIAEIEGPDDLPRLISEQLPEAKVQTPICPHIKETLSDDPHVIPPHPKDPKDIVAIVRRARAIQKLRAMEEAEAAAKASDRGIAAAEKTAAAPRRSGAPQTTAAKAPPALQIKKRVIQPDKSTAVQKKNKKCPAVAEHPPDYIAPEDAAAVFRARNLAGLKTKNPKLLPQPKTPLPAPTPKTPLPPPPATPPPPTYENIMQRAAIIRAKTDAAKAALFSPQTTIRRSSNTPLVTDRIYSGDFQDQLKEFEALEQLYDARPDKYVPVPRREDVNMFNRIESLQRQLLETPPASPVFDLPPIIRYYDLMKRHNEMLAEEAVFVPEECQLAECAVDLQQIQGIADWKLAELSGPIFCSSPHCDSMRATPKVLTPLSTEKIAPECYRMPTTSFGDEFHPALDDSPEYAFPTEAGFDNTNEFVLEDISMPGYGFVQDASLDELGLDDVSSPDLDDLSISLLEPLETDYPIELSDDGSKEKLKIADDEQQKSPGFLTSVVSAVVDKFRNIFAGTPRDDEDDRSFKWDSSLPNLFETTPPPGSPTSALKEVTPPQATIPKTRSPESQSIVIPPHPEDPKDYATMVKRAQIIQKLKAREATAAAPPIDSRGQKKPVVKTSIPKRTPAPPKKTLTQKKNKSEPPPKIYPPGEYSPRYAEAVARARALAGYKNRSAVLNPKRAAKIEALKAEREAALAAEEALPPVERMQKKIARMKKERGQLVCARPSIETLGALEAIRESVAKTKRPSLPTRKWTPAVRRVKATDRNFSKQYERAFGKIKPMTPITEESYDEADLMRFSPLRPHEGRLRLQYLREHALRRATDSEACLNTPHVECPNMSPMTPVHYTPIRLKSPSSPRTDEMRKETITTKLGAHGGEESVREEIIETSTIEDGEVIRTTRKVTTKTDEFGNVTCHLEEGAGMPGEDETIVENIDTIEAPEFLDTSYVPPPRDPSIPSPSEIIDRIRSEVQQKLQLTLPQVQPIQESPPRLDFPDDLPDEQLIGVDMPELVMTSPQVIQQVTDRSANVSLPYCWGEIPPSTPEQVLRPRQPSPPRVSPPIPEQLLQSSASKPKSPERPIEIPPHPKDPKDYVAMVKRAQAIQKLRKQQEPEAATENVSGIPMTRRVGPPLKDRMKKPRRPVRKHKSPQMDQGVDYRECPSEPPAIPPDYAAAVARARQLAGYKNTTEALNPAVAAEIAAKKAAEEAELAAFEKLPAYLKIMKRMERVRRIPPEKRKIEVTADVLGTIAAIRANMPPIEEVLRPPTPPAQPSARITSSSLTSEKNVLEMSNEQDLDEAMKSTQKDIGVIEAPRPDPERSEHVADKSLEEFEVLERQTAVETVAAEAYQQRSLNKPMEDFQKRLFGLSETPKGIIGAPRRRNIVQEFATPHSPLRKGVKTTIEPERVIPRQQSPLDDQAFHNELIEDFRYRQDELQTVVDDLMPSTPVSPKERFKKIKEAQQRPVLPREINVNEEAYASTPSPAYTPISLLSPSEVPYPHPAYNASPDQTSKDGILLNLQTPLKQIAGVKQFRDLHDMPLDEVEFEDEPTLTNVSFDKPITPPPRPSELINIIRKQIQNRLRQENVDGSQLKSPANLQFPDELPDEAIFEWTLPSFAQTPEREPSERQRTPRISLPYAWGEVGPTTTPSAAQPAVSSQQTSPTRTPPSAKLEPVVECPKDPSPESPIIVPPHPKDPKDYRAIVKRAQAIYNLQKKQEAEIAGAAPAPEKTKPTKDRKSKIRRKLGVKKTLMKKEQQQTQVGEETECPAAPPPIPAEYAEAVARARLLAGYKNRTAALNPAVAAKIAQKKAAAEEKAAAAQAEAAAFAALPEHEKIKVRMERLRAKSRRNLRVKPTMEQLAFLQLMKEKCVYESPSPLPLTRDAPRATASKRLSLTPRPRIPSTDIPQIESLEVCPATSLEPAEMSNISLAEFEALEDLDASSKHFLVQPPDASLGMSQIISKMEQQQLATPPHIDARERYKQLLTRTKTTPETRLISPSPVKTPNIHYSPITLRSSPTSPERCKRSEKSTTQVTRSGDNKIREQITETSEIVNGELQHITKHVTTTTDPSGNVTCQINESRRVNAIDSSANIEELKDIGEPSFLDTTPISPTGAPRPKDIIERIRRDVQSRPRPDVPTGRLVELRTPPRELPLPKVIPEEELLEISSPALPKTPPRTPTQSPKRSPERTPNISIPQLFMATPPPPTPPLPPVSPLRHRIPSPEGPIVVPDHPIDPTDYVTMVRRARKIQQLKAQEEAQAIAAKEAESAAALVANEAMSKKKQRVSVQKKAQFRKKPAMKKRKNEELHECPAEPLPLPEGYAEQIARARRLAGLKNRTAALNPKVAERQAIKAAAEAAAAKSRIEQEREAARIIALTDPSAPPADYETLMAKIVAMRKQGHLPDTAVVASPLKTPRSDPIHYTPLHFVSPAYDIADLARERITFDMANFEGLEELGELEELEEPSFLNVSESPIYIDQYMPTSPMTPQPTPSQLISRIRKQVHKQMATEHLVCPTPSRTPPATLNFPDDLPEEELFEESALSFAKTPQKQPTPTRSPNISIPQYFEATSPPPKLPSPKKDTPKEKSPPTPITLVDEVVSPPLLGVRPGVRVKTPEGSISIPPHPKDPADVFAMIQRSQLIHKLKAKLNAVEDERKMADRKLAKGMPPRRKAGRPGGPPQKVMKKMLKPVDKEECGSKDDRMNSTAECPMEPPQLPPDYTAAVARARNLAGLRNTTALLNPPKPPQDYSTIMSRAAALKAQIGLIDPTAPNLINGELEQRRKENDVSFGLEQLQTPRPPMERYRVLRSGMPPETPTTSQLPYSPVKTPDIVDLPTYEPIQLVPSPPCPFPYNVSEPDIGDVSMPSEFLLQNDFNADGDNESKEFQQQNFALNHRVEMLQNEYLPSRRLMSISPRTACVLPDTIESPDLAEFEAIEQYETGPHYDTPSQRTELKQMIDDLNRLEKISKAQERLLSEGYSMETSLPKTGRAQSRLLPGMSPDSEEYSALQSFEAMERKCRTPRHR